VESKSKMRGQQLSNTIRAVERVHANIETDMPYHSRRQPKSLVNRFTNQVNTDGWDRPNSSVTQHYLG
jgi:hypothetical protein